ncbi:ATP-dependent helicase [Methylonatrum kenyense]|uniref:ATP-dependent helicase n=1 Tax=Methylonatrum kenyense TaxID=455253 RepID=UPI0020C116B6|nr:ATP-dependent helicase [Methylonatrum kenyense]MCK8514865.1 ATP-dependent helicase [Methylonatrum kenyense]
MHRILSLDPDQKLVVAHSQGPAAVLAGAGSGKTRCTTERALRRLAEDRLPPASMVLLTFTNRAAAEMRDRLQQGLPAGAELPFIGTFHAFGRQLLRQHGSRIGIPARTTQMDGEDSRRMLDTLLAGVLTDRRRRQAAIAVHEACTARGLDIAAEGDLRAFHDALSAADFGPVAIARCLQRFRRFETQKRESGLLDYSDLILLCSRLLDACPELAAELRDGYRDITVDEAQDTDGAQFRLLQRIAPPCRSILLVGDDDQAIYEWRHARPDNLKDFIAQYRAQVYRLERNYRSRPDIVDSAARLVAHNSNRLEKTPRPVRSANDKPSLHLHLYTDTPALAGGIAACIQRSLDRGLAPDHIAVLYRKKRMVRDLESALLEHGIPFEVRGSLDLLGHADVRMMLAAARLAANPRDGGALIRLAELIPGLGSRGVGRLLAQTGSDPLAAAADLRPDTATAALELHRAVERLRRLGPKALARWCRETPLFSQWLQRRRREPPPGSRKYPRLQAVQRILDKRLGAGDAARQWQQALDALAATGSDDQGNGVVLSTIHAAKGLEWPEVHLAGFTEGLMPLERDGRVQNAAEERRLGYVAITRARECLLLHHADLITLDGGPQSRPTSPYLQELGTSPRQQDHRIKAAAGDARPKTGNDWLAVMREQLSKT